jgi:geranylgeranyl diphosphate synthase, type I
MTHDRGQTFEPGVVLDVREVRARVQAAIDAALADYHVQLAAIGPELEPVYDNAAALLRGGKRLRAAACYWGWRGVVGHTLPELDDAALKAATSLELVHGCALVHDDVMDASDTRRGLPSAHRVFETMHADHSWRGNSAQFGEGAAVLIGDLLLSWADELLFTSGMPPADVLRAKSIYDQMRTELMAGQYLDLLEQASGDGSEDRVMRVARYKSAKYTFERPLQLGGALAGASEAIQQAYSGYGLPLGEAFQLRDDVLGIFGDPAVIGKPAGDDVREGKRTLVIHAALKAANAHDQETITKHLGRRDLSTAEVDDVRAAIINSGGLAMVEERITTLRTQALAALDAVELDPETRAVLTAIATLATVREA